MNSKETLIVLQNIPWNILEIFKRDLFQCSSLFTILEFLKLDFTKATLYLTAKLVEPLFEWKKLQMFNCFRNFVMT